jgi:hypothetical protein
MRPYTLFSCFCGIEMQYMANIFNSTSLSNSTCDAPLTRSFAEHPLLHKNASLAYHNCLQWVFISDLSLSRAFGSHVHNIMCFFIARILGDTHVFVLCLLVCTSERETAPCYQPSFPFFCDFFGQGHMFSTHSHVFIPIVFHWSDFLW